jgi:regulatory protein
VEASQLDIMLEKARRYCLRGEKCRNDLQKKLFQWQIPSHLHEIIINTMIEERFIDESRFARSFINDKCYLLKWGKIKIRYALSGKHIPEPIISKFIDAIDMEKYRNILRELAENKREQIVKKESDPWKSKQKLYAFLLQRGFESEEITKILSD